MTFMLWRAISFAILLAKNLTPKPKQSVRIFLKHYQWWLMMNCSQYSLSSHILIILLPSSGFIQSYIQVNNSFILLFIYLLIFSFIHSFVHLFIYSFIHISVYLFIYSFIPVYRKIFHLFIYSFIYSSTYSFIHPSFIQLLIHLCT